MPWRQRTTLSRFDPLTDPVDGDTGRARLPTDPCPASGDYRIDLYLGSVLQASAEVTPPSSPEALVADDDLLASFHPCRPKTWTVAARGPDLLEVRSPGGAQRLTVGVFPAPPELGRAGAGPALAGLADRLAARRRFQPTGARLDTRLVDDLRGTLRAYQRPGERDRALTSWVSLGPDAVLRTVVLEGAPGDRGLFDRLLARVGSPSWTANACGTPGCTTCVTPTPPPDSQQAYPQSDERAPRARHRGVHPRHLHERTPGDGQVRGRCGRRTDPWHRGSAGFKPAR